MTVKSNLNPSKRRKIFKKFTCKSPQCKISKGGNGCGIVFKTNRLLERHLDPTTKVCEFENCGLSYSQKSALDRHKLTHGIPRPRCLKLLNPATYVCDFENCGISRTTKSDLDRHKFEKHGIPRPRSLIRLLNPTKKRYVCEFENCGLSYSTKGYLDTHKFNDHGIPRPGTKHGKCPPGYNKDIFKFIKNKVRSCITNDKKKMKKEDWEFFNNNEQKHHLAKLLYEREIIQNKAHESLRDKLGGYLPNPLVLLEFGGIFQGSLDRIDRKQNHFVKTNDPISNVQLIPLGMNNLANLSNKKMGDTVEFLRQKIEESKNISQEEADSAVEFQSNTCLSVNRKWGMNTLYASCGSSFRRDERCEVEFKTLGAYFQHCLEILKEQNYRCAVSDIFFENEGDRNPLQISVDAKDPRFGHVPGNLRIIILALNCVVHLPRKKKKLKYPDVPHQWSRDIFSKYIKK